MNSNINILDWGLLDYQSAWDKQTMLFDAQIALKNNNIPTSNTLIFVEHPHVYTLGKSGQEANMLLNDESVPFIRTNRGGDITYHGPGQIVVYPIFDLENFNLGLKAYIYKVEQVVIDLLASYNIDAGRLEGATGVWLPANAHRGERKICAIGVRSSRFITMHGLALNINTDLNYFYRINPCGFTNKGVTSLAAELGQIIVMEEVKKQMMLLFQEEFKKS